MSDTTAPLVDGGPSDELTLPWSDTLEVASLCRNEHAWQLSGQMVAALAERYGVEPSAIVPTLGASSAITHVLMALIRAGDHIIVERPTYEPLRRVPEVLGAQVSRLERKFEENWAVVPDRLAKLLTPRTRAVILTNLHNPSGVGIPADDLARVAELAARVGAMVLVDEVYLDYCFPTEPYENDASVRPVCRVAPNGISWSSTTKAFGFSALRAGWIISADPDAAKAIRATSDYLHVYPPAATSLLGRRVLAEAPRLQQRAQALAAAGRRVVERWLQAESRVGWVPPTAGLMGCLRLPDLMSDTQFADHLRERYDTQVVPGSLFEARGYVRMSFGRAPGDLEQALANITATLDDLL
jgi:hypothetical protein